MTNWLKKFLTKEIVATDIHGLPYLKNIVPMPKVKPCKVEYIIEDCTFTNNSTLEGLKIALKHCTKYEDKLYLSFLIRVELSKYYPMALYGTADVG